MQDLARVGILLVVAGIVVAIGSQILGEIKTSDSMTTITTTNESVNFAANNTYYTLANLPVKTVDAIYGDAANTEALASGSFAYVSGSDGSALIYTNASAGATYNVSTGTHYVSYTSYDVGYNISENTQEGLEDLADWMPTMALVVVATLVIGLIVKNLGTKVKRSM